MIATLAVENYWSLRRLFVPLTALTVVTGGNGTGKSSLYRALRLLADAARNGVVAALAREGGLPSTLWAGPETIGRAVREGIYPVQGVARGKPASLRLGFGGDEFSYAIDFGFPAGGGQGAFVLDPEIKRESIWKGPLLRPSAVLCERDNGIVRIRDDQRAWSEPYQIRPYDSMLSEFADPRQAPEVLRVREQVRSWRFYDHVRTDATAPARASQIGTRTPVMSHDGADVAAALQTIREIGNVMTAELSEGFATVLGMRFLHTSDWHLGRSLHRFDLRQAQAAFLDHLVDTARSERVDAVLVAGDVYDRAIPPVDSVALYEDALARLRATGARVVLISGNHDSARRLGVNSALVDASGVHLRTRPTALAEPVLLADADGEVAVYGVPYLEPALGVADTPDAEPGAGTRSHASVLSAALGLIRADAAARGATRTVVLAHAWVTNGRDERERAETAQRQASASERDISVGGVGYVPASVFDGFGYVALGHLHGRQTLTENMRYSGSPLPYSFSEKDHRKGTWLVELCADGKAAAEWLDAPVYRRLTALRGRVEDLLGSREHDGHEGDFVAVTLTDTVRPEGAMERLRTRFPHILTLEFKPEGVAFDPRSYGQKVKGRDDLTVAAEFVRHVRNDDATAPERELLAAAFTAARNGAAGNGREP